MEEASTKAYDSQMWFCEATYVYDMTFKHCAGEVMPADMLTKPQDKTRKQSEIINLVEKQ